MTDLGLGSRMRIVAASLVLALTASACVSSHDVILSRGAPRELQQETKPGPYRKVQRVIDGDTIVVCLPANNLQGASPELSADDLADVAVGHAESSGQAPVALSGGVPRSQFSYLRLGQFSQSVSLAVGPSVPLTTLRPHVGEVLGERATEKMSGVTARRIIATMQRVQAGRHRAVREDVGETMGVDHATTSPRQAEPSVALSIAIGLPRPALVGFTDIDLFPEALLDGPDASGVVAAARTELDAPSSVHFAGGGQERDSAGFADSWDRLSISHSILRDRVVRDRLEVHASAGPVHCSSGQTLTVRLIGIDTPELHHPTKPVERCAAEAATFMAMFLEGKNVRLSMAGRTRDRYGRVLAFVWRRGLVQERLLKAGLARSTCPPKLKPDEPDCFLTISHPRKARFDALEKEAVAAKVGIWGTQCRAVPVAGT